MAEVSTSNSASGTNPLTDPSPALNTVQSTFDKLLNPASVEAVYGSPISQGENIVIPAAEVLSAIGFGVGQGGGIGSANTESTGSGGGGGGGGGGRVLSRPVAAIVLSPSGVCVEPIVDVTKILLGVFTTVGFMTAMFTRMNKRPPRLTD